MTAEEVAQKRLDHWRKTGQLLGFNYRKDENRKWQLWRPWREGLDQDASRNSGTDSVTPPASRDPTPTRIETSSDLQLKRSA